MIENDACYVVLLIIIIWIYEYGDVLNVMDNQLLTLIAISQHCYLNQSSFLS